MGTLCLQDNTIVHAKSIGAAGTSVGEIVFNTSMTGYQEILTDPSYAGQIVNMTFPLIGNYGVSLKTNESTKVHLKGFVVKELASLESNFTSEMPLDAFLKQGEIVALSGVDTRQITKRIRRTESLVAVISSEDLSLKECQALMAAYKFPQNLVETVSRREIQTIDGPGFHVAVLDFGIKNSILAGLLKLGCKVTLFPYDTSAGEILATGPDGVLLSNGPGDPADIAHVMDTIWTLAHEKPTLGICLGHQLLAMTFGAKTYKLKFGHHGGNHGVHDVMVDKCFITSQNHEYAVDMESLGSTPLTATHRNLNDNTVEGVCHNSLPAFSVQFHPEASPGPQDNAYIFEQFIAKMNEAPHVDSKAG